MLAAQKRYADAAMFFECAAQMAQVCFVKINKEIISLSTGEISLYDIVYGEAGQKLLMFMLLPHMKMKAQTNYTTIAGKNPDEKYDI